MTSTGAEDGAETNGGEDGEEQSDEPVREHEGAPGGAGEVTKPRKSEEWGIRIHVVVVPTTPRRGLMGRDASELRMQLASVAGEIDDLNDRTVASLIRYDVAPPIASHPQHDGREAEEKRQDRQEVKESATKDCEDRMSHQNQIVTKAIEQSRLLVPTPRVPIAIRPATMEDFAAIDSIQKVYHKELGFFPRAQMEGYIKNGWVIVAQDEAGRVVGYCASRDRYLKRDELGAIFQLCVALGSQRKFVGMAMLKHVFEQSPYGCKLYCCWCAQDLSANYFWESMGFVPLAFRTGSAAKSRVHIFWEKRIRSGDETTPYWFPAQTGGGAIREDRLILPIPPGKHWSDEMPRIVPQDSAPDHAPRLPGSTSRAMGCKPVVQKAPKPQMRQRVRIGPPPTGPEPAPVPVVEKPKREKKPKRKNDPKLVAAARELRDRWLEHANADPSMLLPTGKYDVARALVSAVEPALSSNISDEVRSLPALPPVHTAVAA
jgi:hypothetical protein